MVKRVALAIWVGLIGLDIPLAIAQPQNLAVGSLTLSSSTRLNRNEWEYVYYGSVSNAGVFATNVKAQLTTVPAGVTIIDGAFDVGDVPSGATRASIDTFTLRHDRRVGAFSESDLHWSITSGMPPLLAMFRAEPESGDAPLRVTFFPEPITDTAIERYEWDLDGNGSFERSDVIGRTQVFTYTIPGTYTPRLRVTDTLDRQDTQSISIVAGNKPPTVSAEANPSNGPIPLTVTFTGTATDNEGIALYEWDFEGDGFFDSNSTTSAQATHVYNEVGNFLPVLRVTDLRGASTSLAVPTIAVAANPPGSPTVTLNANPRTGGAPLNVNFSGVAANLGGATVTQYSWDFNGDGTFDQTGPQSTATFRYTQAGTFYPRLRITTSAGGSTEDVNQITVVPQFDLDVTSDTIDPGLTETSNIRTVLGADTRVSVVIQNAAGQVVRTLVPFTNRTAGTYLDTWAGDADGGAVLPEGPYYAVLLYDLNGQINRFDLTLTTGGTESNPPRTTMPSRFSPFASSPLQVNFTLTQASEVTAFMGRFNVDTRLVTFLQRQPLGRGTHRIVWNGENGDGVLIHPPVGDSFLFGIFAYRFPDNAIYVRSGAHLSAFTVAPSILTPDSVTADGSRQQSELTFTLSKPADVFLQVSDAETGAILTQKTYPGLPGGVNTVRWDGKADGGDYLASGRYRLGITAVDPRGFQSLTLYALQRIYH